MLQNIHIAIRYGSSMVPYVLLNYYTKKETVNKSHINYKVGFVLHRFEDICEEKETRKKETEEKKQKKN